MTESQIDCCCELGVKGSCVTCDFLQFCNGKWSRGIDQSPDVKADDNLDFDSSNA
jgi:hypothetical protein